MEILILKYLRKNYCFTLSTLTSYNISCRHTGEKIAIPKLMQDVEVALNISEEELFPVFNKWAEEEYTKINNLLVDIEYEVSTMRKAPDQVCQEYQDRISTINNNLQKG